MKTRPQRARRVELAVPGNSEKMMAKAAQSAADLVFLDLEDAVAPSAKVEARSRIVDALKQLDWTGKTRAVRINDLTTPYAYEDIIHVMEHAAEYVAVIIVPKVMAARDLYFVDTLLTQIEKKMKLKRRVGLEALVEEVEAMINVEEIARSSDRLEALILGMGDYSASQGIDLKAIGGGSSYPGDLWHYCRFKMIIACRAAGIEAIDGPFGNFRDPEGYRVECERARILGCVGKWAIHPSQIEIAREAFTPKMEDVLAARELAAAYAEAEAQGLGAINVDGNLVDAASVRLVGNILKRAEILKL